MDDKTKKFEEKMENLTLIKNVRKENWFVKRIKKHQVITFFFGFMLIFRFSTILMVYFADKDLFSEKFVINIWFWAIGIPIIYFLQWLLVVWVASKLPKEKLKQKFLRHPIATIVLFTLYVIDLPYRIAEYSGNVVNIFETIVYYAFTSFLLWLFICWISSKIFKKQKAPWRWYEKIIEKTFVFLSVVYKIIFGLIIAIILFFIIFFLITFVFKYSGQDLKKLFY